MGRDRGDSGHDRGSRFFYRGPFPFLEKTVYTWGNLGRITVPQILGVNHWIIISLFIVGALLSFRWLEKKGL